jgi:hypothetical protein
LKKDGFLNNTPVYIVSIKGLNFPPKGGHAVESKLKRLTLHENNVVVDANSGEILFSYSYR